jgi:hypothetical protein
MTDSRRSGVEPPMAELAGTDLQRADLAGAHPDTTTVIPGQSKDVVASKAGGTSE